MDFRSENELRMVLLQQCYKAVNNVRLEVYKTIISCLNTFYHEFSPKVYVRTWELLNSLVMTDINLTLSGVSAEIYFDASKMHHTTGSWSEETIMDVAMTGAYPHGGYDGASGNTAIWATSMNIIGDVEKKLVQELKKQGVPIK